MLSELEQHLIATILKNSVLSILHPALSLKSVSRKELEVLEKREMFLHDNRNAILKARQEGREEGGKSKALEIAR